jgi:hypothetical protein
MATKPEQLARYKLGWQHGATGRGQDEKYTGSVDRDLMRAYQRGHNDGKDARLICLFEYCERIQHDPLMSVLTAPAKEDSDG